MCYNAFCSVSFHVQLFECKVNATYFDRSIRHWP